ncbi:unnamed protein product [Phytophthora fragariaefolia]|uniref:Unnamed protein product n=1 Tax=Phytophthora fragariaefolia TaxID=1490495 RepID=A0A9W7D9H7_9STRA|nr:unnamed protein product [Phytophthora fragariaefolia]
MIAVQQSEGHTGILPVYRSWSRRLLDNIPRLREHPCAGVVGDLHVVEIVGHSVDVFIIDALGPIEA